MSFGLTLLEYQTKARRTLILSQEPVLQAVLGLGLAGESGEVIEMLKKHVGHGHELDRHKLAKELGDVLWYIAAIATLNDLDLQTVAELNIAKLEKRYPDGFDPKRSQERAE